MNNFRPLKLISISVKKLTDFLERKQKEMPTRSSSINKEYPLEVL
jgi:hypothetical protein